MEDSEKNVKPIYKKWWFWVIFVLIIGALGAVTSPNYNITNSNNNYKNNQKIEVTVVDFSTMPRDEVKVWFNTNKVNGKIIDDYSEEVSKGSFISQSISSNTVIHEGDKITVTYSLGKKPTIEQKNALKKAESYSSLMHMSKQGIYKQLTSSFEGFTKEAAQYAIDNIDADWNENALKKAESYSETMHMSKQGIYKQLYSSVEGFTKEEAQYAIDNIDADWNKNALEKAKSYQQTMSMSKKAVYNQLSSSVEGFTKEEAQYAIDHLDD